MQCSRVDFHRRGQFDAVIARRDGRSFGVVRQGPALPLRPAAGHRRVRVPAPPRHGPGADPQRLGAEADDPVLRAVEHRRLLRRRRVRQALQDWNSNVWRYASWVFESLLFSPEVHQHSRQPKPGRFTEPPERKWASRTPSACRAACVVLAVL